MMQEQDNSYTKFWDEFVDEKGEVYYRIVNRKFIDFLEEKGYRKLTQGTDFQLVKITKNSIVEPVEGHSLREEVGKMLKEKGFLTVLELFMQTDYVAKKYIEHISSINISFNNGTPDTSVLFYMNGAIEVSKDRIRHIPYEEYPGYIWHKQIVPRYFWQSDFKNCEFKTFCYNISGQKEDRFVALQTHIGYLLHSHKDPALTKAVILIDEDINPESAVSNGGTGKSVVANALMNIISVRKKDGKILKTNDKFFFADVELHHRLLVFDDVKIDFPFESLYSVLTGDMPVEKKYKNPVILDFKDVPKVLITSNYVVTGTGGNSEDRRKVTFEVNSYYRTQTSIAEEFGHRFFDDWDENEWSKFDNFMVFCLQQYLTHGLIEAPSINEKTNRLIQETNMDFVKYMDKLIANPRQCFYNPRGTDIKYDKAILYESFMTLNPEYRKTVSQITFKQWIDRYCENKGIEYDHKKSNGNSYVYFFDILRADPNPDNFCNDDIIRSE